MRKECIAGLVILLISLCIALCPQPSYACGTTQVHNLLGKYSPLDTLPTLELSLSSNPCYLWGGGVAGTIAISPATNVPFPAQLELYATNASGDAHTIGDVQSPSFPPISSLTFSTSHIVQMTIEDALIDQIRSSGNITATLTATKQVSASHTFSIPATNCAKLSGSGPRKVVFMRGKSWDTTLAEFEDYVTWIINDGFGQTEPFASNMNKFSFYADVRKFDDSNLLNAGLTDSNGTTIKNSSSCNGYDSISPTSALYIFEFHDSREVAAWTDATVPNFIFINQAGLYDEPIVSTFMPRVEVHEAAHAMGHLFDEYIHMPYGSQWNMHALSGWPVENCTTFPYRDFRSSLDNHVYGSISTIGCATMAPTYVQYPPKGVTPATYYRPSYDSLMRQANGETTTASSFKFNIIGCGYIMAAINGEPVDKLHAQKYWGSDCTRMANAGTVVSDGIPAASSAPVIASASMQSQSPGFPMTISGSGFTATDNAVRFTNTSSGLSYDASSIASPSGTTIAFNVPPDALPGSYTVKAGAFNSDWSATALPFKVIAAIKPTLALSSDRSTIVLGDTLTFSWTSQGAYICHGSTPDNTASAIWSTSGRVTDAPTKTGKYVVTCQGQGGSTQSTYQIVVAPLPTVTLSAAPKSVSAGGSTKLSWLSTGATSCSASGGWSGSKALSGSYTTVPSGTTTFTLTCTDAYSRTASASVTIAVSAPAFAPLPALPSPSPMALVQIATNGVTLSTGVYYYFRLPQANMSLDSLNLRQASGFTMGVTPSQADNLYFVNPATGGTMTLFYLNYGSYSGWYDASGKKVTTTPNEFMMFRKYTGSVAWTYPAGTYYYGSNSTAATNLYNAYKAKYGSSVSDAGSPTTDQMAERDSTYASVLKALQNLTALLTKLEQKIAK